MTEKFVLKDFQQKALRTLKKSKIDLLCIAPTGAGKGVIIEELAKGPAERILLLSPLIALGRQQQFRLNSKKISAICTMGSAMIRNPSPETRVWILSPESALSSTTERLILQWNPTLVVIDECHCVVEWGSEFRPAYGHLPKWLKECGFQRTLWMSATVPSSAISIIESGLSRELTVQGSFALPKNLDIRFLQTPWTNRLRILTRLMMEKSEGGIVFTSSRQMTERVQRLVQATGRSSFFYHAGLSNEERRLIETKIQKSLTSIVVATSAFGMGMDYQNLTWVVLWQPPRTVLSLAQALGRVGRNQSPGQALMLWDDEDLRFVDEEVRVLLKKDASGHLKKYLEKYFH